MADKTINLYPVFIESNDSDYFPEEFKISFLGVRTKNYKGKVLSVNIHLTPHELECLFRKLMAPYKKLLRDVIDLGIKIENTTRLPRETKDY